MEKTCPQCLTQTEVQSQTETLAFVCGNCGARAITLNLLQKYFVAPHWRGALDQTRKKILSRKKRCQQKDCQMQVVGIQHPHLPEQEVEICFRCHQVWFDLHELELLAGADQIPFDQKIPESLQQEVNQIEVRDGQAIPRHTQFAFNQNDFSITFANKSFKQLGWRAALALIGLPIEHQNRLRHKPWVTWSLISGILLVSLFSFHIYPDLFELWGFRSSDPWRYFGLTALSSFLLHADYGHLLGNLYMLYIFGDNVEEQLGLGFPGLVVLGTLAGVALHGLLTTEPNIILVGASTGLSAIILYYALSFPRAQFSIFLLKFIWIRVPVFFYIAVWIGLQVVGIFRQGQGIQSISFAGHLGGAAVGLGLWLWRRLSVSSS